MPRLLRERLWLVLVGVLLSTPSLMGDISLPKIFSDHMVLQQKSAVKIWGQAEPGQKLVLTFIDKQTTLQANAVGQWSTLIRTPEAGGPFELEIADQSGEPKVVFTDVMVGEVWICSGQSNMEWPLTGVLNPETEIEQARNYPNLRLFTVDHSPSPQPLEDFINVTPWSVCTPEAVKSFSAAAYFFGRELSKELGDIPVGLINSSWGGTRCEAWTSRDAMDDVEDLAPLLRYWDENDDTASQHRPANLFNGMIAPLTQFEIRGAIWYQGEANHGRGHQYATLFPTMIEDWRTAFGVGDFPFYFVQLAPFRYKNQPASALAEIWDAQLKTLKSVNNTGMVVTTDIGNIDNIHPANKQEVGRRLALIALANIYQDQLPNGKQDLIASGPIYESMSTNQDQIRLTFEHVGKGLRKRFDDEELRDFTICGDDRQFVPANAIIESDVVIVSSPEVKQPIAVRFGWSDTAEPNLVNSAGLPASPFRTDDFPLESIDRSF